MTEERIYWLSQNIFMESHISELERVSEVLESNHPAATWSSSWHRGMIHALGLKVNLVREWGWLWKPNDSNISAFLNPLHLVKSGSCCGPPVQVNGCLALGAETPADCPHSILVFAIGLWNLMGPQATSYSFPVQASRELSLFQTTPQACTPGSRAQWERMYS